MRFQLVRAVVWLTLLGAPAARGQGPDSAHAGGADVNLPRPESKADALSGNPQMTSQDSTAVLQRHFVPLDVPQSWLNWGRYSGK